MYVSITQETDSSDSNQELPSILWYPKVHYHFHKSLPFVPALCRSNSVLKTSSYFAFVRLNIICPPTSCFALLLIYARSYFPIRATYPTLLILPDLIIRIIIGELYNSSSSSLWSFRHLLVTSSLFDPNILLSNLFPNIFSPWSTQSTTYQVPHPYGTTKKTIIGNLV